MKKRLIGVFLILVFIISYVPIIASAATNIEIGQYIQMGTYYGEPILWRCVDIDENGPLILSDKIICYKAYDAAGDNLSGSHGTESDAATESRKKYGSNYWGDSNLRCWLNSRDSAGNVNWACGNQPNQQNFKYVDEYGYDDHLYIEYYNEAGFLTNFSPTEIAAMKTVTQRTLIDFHDDPTTNKRKYQKEKADIDELMDEYDSIPYTTTTDTMFILDVRQLKNVYENSDVLGNKYWMSEMTKEAANNSNDIAIYMQTDNYDEYWLRSPYGSAGVHIVNDGGHGFKEQTSIYSSPGMYQILSTDALHACGVRPAFYFNAQNSVFTSGNGSKDNPYTVSANGDTVERGFDITRDGWSVINHSQSFGYEKGYKIPVERWTGSYGDAIKPLAENFTKEWRGNCYGMSALASCIYAGFVDWDSSREINETTSGVSKYIDDYGKATNIDILKLDLANSREIERYQISQYSVEYSNMYNRILSSNKTYASMFYDVVKAIRDEKKTFIVLAFATDTNGNSVGHAMVTDTSRPMEYRDGGWCKIYLYDPNYPHYDNNENYNLAGAYKKYDDRYVEINYITGEWILTIAQNADGSDIYCTNWDKYKTIDNNPSNSDCQLLFEDYSWQKDYLGFDYTLDYNGRWYNTLYASGTDIKIMDTKNNALLTIEDGQIRNQSDQVYVRPIMDSGNSDGVFNGVISLENSAVNIILANGVITSLGNNKAVQISADNRIQVLMVNNSSIHVTAEEDSDVNVVTENIRSRDDYNALTINGDMSKDEYIFIFNYGYSDYEISSNAEGLFDIEKDNNGRIENERSVDLSQWNRQLNSAENNQQKYNSQETTNSINNKEKIKNAPAYSDVTSNNAYFNAINFLSKLDIINGYEDGTFKPEKNITRAEFTKLAVCALGEESKRMAESRTGNATKFNDVPKNHWASGYISVGVNNSMINGMDDVTFAPEENITFVQAMKMLVCMSGYSQWSVDAGGWPNGYLKYANEIGIGEGVNVASNNTVVTRGQVAQMIYNVLQAPIVVYTGRSDEVRQENGIGEDFNSILIRNYDIYIVNGYLKDESNFVITSSRNFMDEYYPEDSNETIELNYMPYSNSETQKPATAFIYGKYEDNYSLIYMY